MITYELSTDDTHKLHVHKVRGKRARCGLMLGEPEMFLHDATNVDVAKLLNTHNRGCWACFTELLGLPPVKGRNGKARLR